MQDYQIEQEKAVLGMVLLDDTLLDSVIPEYHIQASTFTDSRNAWTFNAMLSMHKTGVKIDLMTLTDYLMNNGHLSDCGGMSYLTGLNNTQVSTANAAYYLKQIVETYQQKKAQLYLAQLERDCEKLTGAEFSAKVESSLAHLAEINSNSEGIAIQELPSLMNAMTQDLTYRHDHQGELFGIPSGFTHLDYKLNGFQKEELIVIAARPSMGKTSLAECFILNNIKAGVNVGFFSLEMDKLNITKRIVSIDTGVPLQAMKRGTMTDEQYEAVADTFLFKNQNLYLIDTPNMMLADIKSKTRYMVNVKGVKIIYIDYMGLISLPDNKLSEYERISIVAKELKSIAREFHIPVVVLCQLNRGAETQGMTLANLSGSGKIEDNADVIMMIEGERAQGSEEVERKLRLEKVRNGETGTIQLRFVPSYTKYEEI